MRVDLSEYIPLSATELEGGFFLTNTPIILTVYGVRYVVPAGFVTDFSSIPAGFRFLVRFSKVRTAGALHDFLYKEGEWDGKKVSRKRADKIWREVAKVGPNKASKAQAWTAYVGLRMGGWKRWAEYRKMSKNNV